MDLSGNFGELRSNHYHMGVDLRTNRKENLPVFAAAAGYIAKVKIEPGGFGRAIYINHPNGFTTLYAHLNNFNQRLEQYVKREQYQQQSWRILIDIPAGLFSVKKGDFLAYSGNTGGSEAPHLHFEIRKTEQDVNVNPLLFSFPLADNVTPRILRMAVYDRTKSIYESSPRIIPVKKLSTNLYYTSPGVLTVSSPKISFGISAIDSHNGSTNPNGIYESVLYVDDRTVISFRMDNISYNDTRYLNAHIDYKTKSSGGWYIQHLSELPGYINSIYEQIEGDGVIDISDGKLHEVKIEVKDTNGNSCLLHTKVQYSGNYLSSSSNSAGKRFYPLMLDGIETDQFEFYVGERCLYDSVSIRHTQTQTTDERVVSDMHSIGSRHIPLHEPILIRIKPHKELTPDEQKRTLIQWFSGGKKDVQKVEWGNGWASALFRDFGSYQLIVDQEPPVIVPVGFSDSADLRKASRIVFTIKDNHNKFKNVRTELDGKWLRFSNDKGKMFIYRFDENCLAGEHELMISAEDEAGNTVVRKIAFRR